VTLLPAATTDTRYRYRHVRGGSGGGGGGGATSADPTATLVRFGGFTVERWESISTKTGLIREEEGGVHELEGRRMHARRRRRSGGGGGDSGGEDT
jgi:hypothetical protein